ncbi:MAG: alpha/beta hydrolase [Gemmatimonadaceae bacterium]|nr:alpha/beta hydrolase [Chitinophagaceae bacterium]
MFGTATDNVSILDENFYFPSLNRHRRLWVYLPKDYHTSDQHYRVIYMHDGQNLFDEFNAFGSEWGIDETLDAENGKVIVIGIDNGAEHRMSEYMLHDHPDHGSAEGSLYLKDITEVLKPWVDNNLRTLHEPKDTAIAGSSMGGLISLYAGLYFPHIYGVVGIFSPAIWLDAPRIFQEADEVLAKNSYSQTETPQRWYFYGGALESENMVAEVATMVKIFRKHPFIDVTYQIDAGGTHDEVVWKNYFPNFYKWFTGMTSAETLEEQSHLRLDDTAS